MTNFTNRASYITYVAEWKEAYKDQSANIRVARQNYKEAMRAYHQNKGQISAVWSAISELSQLRQEATTMLQERAASKVEACRQMMEEREAANV